MKNSFVGLNQSFFKADVESCHFISSVPNCKCVADLSNMFHIVKWKNYFAYQTDTDTGWCKSVGSQQDSAPHHQLWGSTKPAELWQRLGSLQIWGDTSCRIIGWMLLISRTSRDMRHTMWVFFTLINKGHVYCYYVQSERENQDKSAADNFNEEIHSDPLLTLWFVSL